MTGMRRKGLCAAAVAASWLGFALLPGVSGAGPGMMASPPGQAIAGQGNRAVRAIRQESLEQLRSQQPAHPSVFLPAAACTEPTRTVQAAG